MKCHPVENNQLRASVEELKTLLYEARAQHFAQLDELRYSLCVAGEAGVCVSVICTSVICTEQRR